MNILLNKIKLTPQREILDECIRKEIPLADALLQKGLSYDSLRYCEYTGVVPKDETSETLDNTEKNACFHSGSKFLFGSGRVEHRF